MSHVIRLARPWQLISSGDQELVVSRSFHRPTGLVPDQRVWLYIECSDAAKIHQASLNDQLSIASGCLQSALQIPIERYLQPANQLVLSLRSASVDAHFPVEFPRLENPNRLDITSWATVHLEIENFV